MTAPTVTFTLVHTASDGVGVGLAVGTVVSVGTGVAVGVPVNPATEQRLLVVVVVVCLNAGRLRIKNGQLSPPRYMHLANPLANKGPLTDAVERLPRPGTATIVAFPYTPPFPRCPSSPGITAAFYDEKGCRTRVRKLVAPGPENMLAPAVDKTMAPDPQKMVAPGPRAAASQHGCRVAGQPASVDCP